MGGTASTGGHIKTGVALELMGGAASTGGHIKTGIALELMGGAGGHINALELIGGAASTGGHIKTGITQLELMGGAASTGGHINALELIRRVGLGAMDSIPCHENAIIAESSRVKNAN